MTSTADEAASRPGAGASFAETALLVLVGGGAGLLLALLPASGQELVSTALTWSLLLAGFALLAREQRRRRVRLAAEGAPHQQDAVAVYLLNRPSVRRAYDVVLGLLLAQVAAIAGSVLVAGAVVLGGAFLLASLPQLVRRSRRRQHDAAAAAHPGAAVVLVALVDLASMRLAQWSKAARATLPADLGGAGVLVADADGVALHRGGRPARLVHRWRWDEVELSAQPHPEDAEAAVLVLTLLGPAPAPRARAVPVTRRRFDVTLAVRDGALPARAPVVEAAIASLAARRPGLGAGSDAPGGAQVR